MELVKELAKTKKANDLFKVYYAKNNWSLKIPIGQFLHLDFRYQAQVFIDFFSKLNLKITTYENCYSISILSIKLLPDGDKQASFLFEKIGDDLYLVTAKQIGSVKDLPVWEREQEVLKEAVLAGMKLIHAGNGKGFIKLSNKKK